MDTSNAEDTVLHYLYTEYPDKIDCASPSRMEGNGAHPMNECAFYDQDLVEEFS